MVVIIVLLYQLLGDTNQSIRIYLIPIDKNIKKML